MPIHNAEVADKFREIADLLAIQEANEFRVRSYRNAARTVSSLTDNVVEMARAGDDLTELSGIGDSIAQKIEELAETGELAQLKELESETPPGLRQLMDIEGLGPKRVATIYEQLQVSTLDELAEAARDGRIRQLEGFGQKMEQKILDNLERARQRSERTRLEVAEQHAESLVAHLEQLDAIGEVVVAGSYRRRRETVGDLDILVTCGESEAVMEAFVDYEDVERVEARGDTKTTVHLRTGLQVDLRVVDQACYGAALHYFTGSKAHNIAVRKRGIERGLKINEYGVFRADEDGDTEGDDGERVAGATEREVYECVDMAWVPPELREGRGELEAAADGTLPELVELEDLRGDLQMHTPDSDGRDGLESMVETARQIGHDYIGITDHSGAVSVTTGLEAEGLREQMERIDALNDKLGDFRVLKGCEVDILEDGTLDLDDAVLEELDFTVCSVHSHFDLDRGTQTDRLLRAMEHPQCTILGHPTGRRIGKRDGIALDIERVAEAAAERGVVLEVNAQPGRLDLRDTHIQTALEAGATFVISTDAHSSDQLRNLGWGVDQARRGWLQADDIINTRPVEELLEILER